MPGNITFGYHIIKGIARKYLEKERTLLFLTLFFFKTTLMTLMKLWTQMERNLKLRDSVEKDTETVVVAKNL